MLTSDGLLNWFQQRNVPESTRATINQVRSAAPSRRVRGGRSNVSGRYPSRKMGVTIQFESHRVELAGIYEMEHDAGVLEYYDQPPPIKLDYESAAGKKLGVVHTPDFFVIRDAEAGWEEWKTEDGKRRNATYYWENLESLKALSAHPKHIEAKQKYAQWYNGYHVVISEVIKSYGDSAFTHATIDSL